MCQYAKHTREACLDHTMESVDDLKVAIKFSVLSNRDCIKSNAAVLSAQCLRISTSKEA